MSIEIRVAETAREINQFINVPFSLYKNSPYWVPTLKISQKDMLKEKHPFYKDAQIKHFLAIKDGEVVGRISAILNQKYNKTYQSKCGFLGFYECIDDQKASDQLFKTAESYLKSLGMTEIQGPVSPSTNYECGTLIKGFEYMPYLMTPYNFPYHQNHWEKQNYEKAMDLICYSLNSDFQFPSSMQAIFQKIEKSKKITYRHVNLKKWDEEVSLIQNIYNQAWEKNWGFIPMSPQEFKALANELKFVADDEMILFAMVDNKEVGFLACLPDYNQIFKKIPSGRLFPTGIFKLLFGRKKIDRVRAITFGILPKYRRLGIPVLLFKKIQEVALKKGYKSGEMGWVLESNLAMNKPILKLGANPYRVYRIFKKKIS